MTDLDDAIFDLILTETYRPGQKLNELELAARFGVSRTPIRDALRRLASSGVVTVEHNKGARVTQYSREDVAALYSARALMESHAARLAAATVDDDAVDALRRSAEDMHEKVLASASVADIAAANNEFHALVLSHCPNARLRDLVGSLVKPIVVSRNFRNYTPDEMRRSAMHHLDIVDALSRRDEDWVEAAMRSHIRFGYHRAIAQ